MFSSTVKTSKNVCRTCMAEGEPEIEKIFKTRRSGTLVPIYNEQLSKHSGKITILELIKESAPQLTIELEDMLPKFVCKNCLDILNNIHDFQQMSIRNEHKMRDFLKMLPPLYETNTDPLRKNHFKSSENVVAPIEVDCTDSRVNEGMTDDCHKDVVVERDRLSVKGLENENNNICMDHRSTHKGLCPGMKINEKIDNSCLKSDSLEIGSPTNSTQDETNLYKKTSINATNKARNESVKGHKIKQRDCFEYQSKTNTANVEKEFISSESQSPSKNHINHKIHNKPKSKNFKMSQDLAVINMCNNSDEDSDWAPLPNEEDGLREVSPVLDNLHFESGGENYVCCGQFGKRTKTRLGLERHTKFYQLNQMFSCDECDKSLSTRTNLERHKRKHARDKQNQLKRKENAENGYVCSECGMRLKTLTTFRRHHLLRHEKDESKIKFRCQYCDKVFHQSTTLQDHIRTHTGERPFLCSICGKVFATQYSLDLHYRRHGSDLKYQCPECPKRFRCASNMSAHKANVHTKDRPHVCDVCGASFKKPYALTKHKITHGEKRNKCDFCDMRFAQPDQCRRHMRTHTGEKPYKCRYCDRAYIQSNDMIKHMRVHLGDNVYRCELCPQAFRLLCELRLHFSTHKDDDEDTKLRNLQALKKEDLRIQDKISIAQITHTKL